MKSLIPIAVLAGAVAGGGTALLAGTVLRPAPEPAQVVSPDDDLLADLAASLKRVEEENQELADRVSGLEGQLALVRPERQPAAAAPASDAVAVDDELKDLAAALRDPDSVPPPASFQESVNRALQNIRADEEHERDERRRQAYEERLDERLSELALDLGLTKNQSDGLRSLYLEQNERRMQLMDEARDGNWSTMRDSFREMREQMDQRLAQILTPDQLQRYNEQAGDGRGWGGPGFGGPDRGGRDRGGNGGPGGNGAGNGGNGNGGGGNGNGGNGGGGGRRSRGG
jgi:hypothetical protein